MTDPFEAKLQRAGRATIDDAATQRALTEAVVAGRPSTDARRPRRLLPAIALGAGLTLAAPVAVMAAVQVGTWLHVTDPDLTVARTWIDVDGAPLGSCETRIALSELPADARDDFAAYFAQLDIDAVDPHPETVAGMLNSVGRLEEIGRLIPGAQPSDFEVVHEGDLWDADDTVYAQAMQEGVMSAIHQDMLAEVGALQPDVYEAGLGSLSEMHCTAPTGAPQP